MTSFHFEIFQHNMNNEVLLPQDFLNGANLLVFNDGNTLTLSWKLYTKYEQLLLLRFTVLRRRHRTIFNHQFTYRLTVLSRKWVLQEDAIDTMY